MKKNKSPRNKTLTITDYEIVVFLKKIAKIIILSLDILSA